MDRNLYLNCVCGRQKIVDDPKVARREGVIEGLERALSHASDPGLSNWAIKRLIKVDVERLRAALDAEKRQADSTADHDNPSNHAGK